MPLTQKLLLKLSKIYATFYWQSHVRALKDPVQAQAVTLRQILKQTKLETLVPDLKAFQTLPLRSYDDYQAQIETSGHSKNHYLTHQKPIIHEATSGSSGAKKMIPYTPALLMSFTRMFLCWVYDLLRFGPKLSGGCLYFSVSPQFSNDSEGLNDDSDYLRGPSAWLFKQFMLVPTQIKHLQNPDDFLTVLAAYLISREDLEVISIWSPSFLLSVLAVLQKQMPEIVAHLKQGYVIKQALRFDFDDLSPAQARRVEEFSANPQESKLQSLFPGLKLISCWAAQNAAPGFKRLQQIFPQALVQPKGLLATEAPLSWPSLQYHQDLPMLKEVFFEFLDSNGQIQLLHQVKIDQEYELIISQKGGLLRYRLGDYVRITGMAEQTPCFEFIGRGQDISDLVGEKLSERFVAQIAQKHYANSYFCLIPQNSPTGYVLCSDSELDPADFESHLMASPHYFNAIALKQLQPLQYLQISNLPHSLKDYFVNQRQMLRGDIKDRYLFARENDGNLIQFLKTTPH